MTRKAKASRGDDTVTVIKRMLMMGDAPGVVLYSGPSTLNGGPIIVIATNWNGSDNEKTGNLVQTFILAGGVHPAEAARTGKDEAACGDCGRRSTRVKETGLGRCYVNLAFSVSSVYRALNRGSYIDLTGASDGELSRLCSGLDIRLGTYGDPAAAPARIWQAMVAQARTWAGYTHQWKTPAADPLKALAMASVDSEADAREARAAGWRTFRVAAPLEWSRMPGEGLCPASYEAGHATTCERCGLCSGTSGKGSGSIVIPDHSSAAVMAKRRAGVMPPQAVRVDARGPATVFRFKPAG